MAAPAASGPGMGGQICAEYITAHHPGQSGFTYMLQQLCEMHIQICDMMPAARHALAGSGNQTSGHGLPAQPVWACAAAWLLWHMPRTASSTQASTLSCYS